MDNKIFNVNGETKELLLSALTLLFEQGGRNTNVKAWSISPEKGFILHQYTNEKATPFPISINAKTACDIVWEWLKSDEAKKIKINDPWDVDLDFDGHSKEGWRVYTEDWGHVDGQWSALAVITPCYLWYGK